MHLLHRAMFDVCWLVSGDHVAHASSCDLFLFLFFFSCAHQRVFSTGSGRRGGQDTAEAGQRSGVSTGLRQGVVQVYQRAAGMGGEASQYG